MDDHDVLAGRFETHRPRRIAEADLAVLAVLGR